MKPMKTFIKSGWQILSISILLVPGAARGHDGWVEISPAIVEKNQNATIALIQGNHSNEHKSYRIAGKWDPKYATLVVVDPKGTANTITDRLIDMGEDAETIGPKGPKGFHLASFVPKDEGLYHALARQVRTVQQGDGPKVVTYGTAKTAFAALKVPTVGAATKLKGFDRLIAGEDVVEFIPVMLNTAYGNLLTLKLALVGLMFALGAFNRFSTKPALARAASSATAEPRTAKAYIPIGWEGALGMAVLVVTGFLTTLPPGVHSAHNLTQRQDESTLSPAHSHAPANLLAPAEGASVKIVTPKAGQAYKSDSVRLEFELKKGKRGEHVHAYIDGEMMGMFKTPKGTLTGIKPGDHTLELRVTTEDHKTELDATDKVRFTVK